MICLLATDKATCTMLYRSKVQRYIKQHGAWASWWSFPIKDLAVPYLIEKPFYLYISIGGGVFTHRWTIIDYVSSHGNKGIMSPWKEITKLNNKVFWAPCKTWFKTTAYEEIKPLHLADFIPITGLSKENTLICRNTFGYAFLKQGRMKDE